jgi:ribose-phosphate pyrophosphokinase
MMCIMYICAMLLFATAPYQYLLQELIAILPDAIAGDIHSKQFPDGEVYHCYKSNLHEQQVVIIGGTIDDASTLELYDLAVGAAQNGASEISLVIPYFGYSTMERMVHGGEVVKAKSRALLFSAIPAVSTNIKVFLFDLHSEGIPYYFGSNIRATHVYCKPLILQAAKQLKHQPIVLASTDAGRAKWVESLANELGVESAFVYKNRLSGSTTEVTGVNAEVKDKHVLIYDDMIRTGGSLIAAAQAYKSLGAASINVMCTHGLFTNDAIAKIKSSGIVEQIICTNTHPNAVAAGDAVVLLNVAELVKAVLG